MIRLKYAAMILIVSATTSTGADDEADKKMLKDLEGSYEVIAFEVSGEDMLKRFLDMNEKITIKDDKLSFIRKGEKPRMQTIKINAAKKPAHFDLTVTDGPAKGDTVIGIIVIDGDMIKICINGGIVGERPTEFKTAKGDERVFMKLKKIKE